MKSDNYNPDELFDRVRKSPTELSQQKVEQMIKGFANAPLKPPIKKEWWNNFNLNTLIMLAVPIAIALGLMAYNGTGDSSDSTTGFDLVLKEDVPGIETTSDEKIAELPTMNIPEVIDTKTILEEKAKEQNVVTTDKVDDPIAPAVNTVPPASDPVVSTNEKPKPEPSLKKYRGTSVAPPMMNRDPDPLPDLGGLYMRRLKRQLYKNLIADGFLTYKGEPVEMELLGSDIIVNGNKMNGSLLLKYSNLTRKVGAGPDRKIKMNDLFFKAGDFDLSGNWKGSGVGTFISEQENEPRYELSEKMEKDELISIEQNELNLFCKQIQRENKGKGGSNLFSVNIKNKKLKELFDKLHRMLVADELVISKKDYVLVELPKNEIRINEKVLEGDLAVKYAELFSSYKIKRGAMRQVRLSEHTISVGDFKPGSFSGTSASFE